MDAVFSHTNNGLQIAVFSQPLVLRCGATLPQYQLAFTTYGKLNADKSNAVLVLHALASGSHLASTEKDASKGWWESLVGPGKGIDTDKLFVICINNLGSCYGSTGPSAINPETGQPYRASFPDVSLEDVVTTQKHLLNALGIKQLHAIIGGSMGGMLALAWASAYPDMAKHLIAISMSHKSFPLQKAHRTSQREALKLDPTWQDGNYASNPVAGLKLARMISHLFYRGLEEVDARFQDEPVDADGDAVVNYYHYNSDKFAAQYDANSYLLFLDAMDKFNIEQHAAVPFKGLKSKVRIVSTDTDVLYPPRQQTAVYEMMQAAGVDVELIKHQSPYGHDAFLVDAAAMAEYLRVIYDEAFSLSNA